MTTPSQPVSAIIRTASAAEKISPLPSTGMVVTCSLSRAMAASAMASSSGSSTTLSCSLGSVRAITAEIGFPERLIGRCGTPAGM